MKFVNLSPMQAWAFEQFTVLIKPCWLSGYGGDTFQWMWCCLLLDKYKVSNSGWVVCLMNCRASVMWRSILPVLPDFEKIFQITKRMGDYGGQIQKRRDRNVYGISWSLPELWFSCWLVRREKILILDKLNKRGHILVNGCLLCLNCSLQVCY